MADKPMMDMFDEVDGMVESVGSGILSEESLAEARSLIIRSKRTIRKRIGGETVTLLHFSDAHGDASALARILAWYERNADLVDEVVCTGDLVYNNYAEDIAYWRSIPGAERVLTCIGNHDVQPSATDKTHYGISVEQAAARYVDPFVPFWGEVIHEAGTTWYAKDIETAGVRFIMLDTLVFISDDDKSADSDRELAWLEERLAEALERDLAVVIGEHFPIAEANMVDSPWQPFDGRFVYGPFMHESVAERVQAFIDAGGVFVCYLCGHCHTDAMHTLPGHPEQFASEVPSATDDAVQSEWGDIDRTLPEAQDCFNVLTVDRANGLVKFVRVGADRSLALQHRGVFTWDFVNHRLVYAD